MERMILGKTGLEVYRLGFGGIPIQRVPEKDAVETVLHAVRCGIDFIDTARGYTTSEERIGKALQQTGEKVVLASKSPSRTADGIRADIEISLKNLKQDFIDIYQCHYVKDTDDYRSICAPDGALAGMLRAKEEGLIGFIGITSHNLELLQQVIKDNLVDTIMVCFSFLEPAAKERVIPRALEKNIGVIAMKSFSGGVLDDPRPALKYVLSQHDVLVIPGVEHKALFDANWQVYQGDWRLDRKEIEMIEETRRRYDKSFCRRCDYCQPCSEEIPIQLVLGLRYSIKRFGDAMLQKDWVKQAVEKARKCSVCEECKERCPYDLPIPDLIKENLDWMDRKTDLP